MGGGIGPDGSGGVAGVGGLPRTDGGGGGTGGSSPFLDAGAAGGTDGGATRGQPDTRASPRDALPVVDSAALQNPFMRSCPFDPAKPSGCSPLTQTSPCVIADAYSVCTCNSGVWRCGDGCPESTDGTYSPGLPAQPEYYFSCSAHTVKCLYLDGIFCMCKPGDTQVTCQPLNAWNGEWDAGTGRD